MSLMGRKSPTLWRGEVPGLPQRVDTAWTISERALFSGSRGRLSGASGSRVLLRLGKKTRIEGGARPELTLRL